MMNKLAFTMYFISIISLAACGPSAEDIAKAHADEAEKREEIRKTEFVIQQSKHNISKYEKEINRSYAAEISIVGKESTDKIIGLAIDQLEKNKLALKEHEEKLLLLNQ